MTYVSSHIASPLSHMINSSLLAGIVPSKHKIAKVIPILINDPQFVLSNYRPISIIPTFSKFLDKAVLRGLFSFLNKYDIFQESQIGFMPGRNTSHSILSLVGYVYNSLESKQIICGIFLDISKAFDAIDHNIFWGKT